MKKYLIIISLIGTTAMAQQPQAAGFRIEGHVKGLDENSVVTFSDANKPTDTLARASVKGGVFILTGRVDEPNLFILNFNSAQKKSSLFIGNESVTIHGDIENMVGMEVKGSSSENDFLAFESMFNPDFAHINQLSQMANAPGYASKKDSIGEAYQLAAMSVQVKVDSFIQQRKNSYVSPFLLIVVNQLSDDIFFT